MQRSLRGRSTLDGSSQCHSGCCSHGLSSSSSCCLGLNSLSLHRLGLRLSLSLGLSLGLGLLLGSHQLLLLLLVSL